MSPQKKIERKTSQTKQYNTISINVKRSDGLPVRSVRITCSRSLPLVHLYRGQVLVHDHAVVAIPFQEHSCTSF